jgi:hypothetical protein
MYNLKGDASPERQLLAYLTVLAARVGDYKRKTIVL